MNVRYLFVSIFSILLINIELYAKNSDYFEQFEDQPAQIRGNRNKTYCSLSVRNNLKARKLKVCGNSCLHNLTVLGNEAINGNLNINGQLFINGNEILASCCQANNPVNPVNPVNCRITTPARSTNNAIVLFSGATGKILTQSPAPVTIDGANNIDQINNITMSGNLNMVNTTDDFSSGVITKNNQPFIHNAGGSSTFVGLNAGKSGGFFENTAMGSEGLQSLTIGRSNTAVGFQVLRDNTSGNWNTAVGAFSLIQNISGTFNTALGYNTMLGNLTGQGNVAIGVDALQNSTGSNNVAIGFGAGMVLGAGANNIYIGKDVGPALSATNESFVTRIGIEGIQMACVIAGIYGKEIDVNTAIPVLVDINGRLGTMSSSCRYKQDIVDMLDSTANLMNLRPVTFRYKPEIEKSGALQYGLIAEEVAEIYPDLVVYNKDNQPESVKYHVLNVMLLNEVKKLIKRQEKQDNTIKKLIARIVKLEGEVVS